MEADFSSVSAKEQKAQGVPFTFQEYFVLFVFVWLFNFWCLCWFIHQPGFHIFFNWAEISAKHSQPLPLSAPQSDFSSTQKNQIGGTRNGFQLQKRAKKFEKQLSESEKKYRDAGMSEEQVAAMREFEEDIFRKERVYGTHIVLEESKEYPGLIEFAKSNDNYFQGVSANIDNILEATSHNSEEKIKQLS
jgi:hypothetical protein